MERRSDSFRNTTAIAGLIAALTLLAWPSATGAADDVIKQRAADGTMVFSDAPLNPEGQRIVYAGNYGRAPATASCEGQTSASLAARASQLMPEFQQAAKQSGTDIELLMAVARIESCFDVKARSVAGAQGVMQLMPATAAMLGVHDAFDAKANITGGAVYLTQMLSQHQGNISLALAAYNAGPGAVAKYGGIPPYPETVQYVDRVTKQLAKNRRNPVDNSSL